MQALTIVPGVAGTLRLDAIDEPPAAQGAVLVRTLAVGVCGRGAGGQRLRRRRHAPGGIVCREDGARP